MALWQAEDYGVIANRVCWSLFALTTVVVGLRLYCRAFFGRGPLGRLGLDDLITAVCVAILLLTCIFITIGASYGLGRRQASLSADQVVHAVKWNAIINCVLIWSFSLPKFAIIAILKRILDYGLKTAVLFWSLALTSQACFLATSVWWFAQCKPVAYQWDRSIPGGQCASVNVMLKLGYFTSAYSAFLDLFFALYPIPFIMRLNMPLKNRVAVCCAMGLQGLAFIVSIYKLAIFDEVFKLLATDLTYSVPFLDIWGIVEGSILIICASLPALGPLVRLARGKLSSYGTSRSAQNKSSENHHNHHHHHRRRSQSRSVTVKSNGNSNWSNIRGHKLDDPENASTTGTGMHSSVDDIPLVTTTIRVSHELQDEHQQRHKPSTAGSSSKYGGESV